MKLIKQCVEYVKSKTVGKKVSFVMTTNATLLNDETVDYLQSENFEIMVSLDGSKKEHDEHRKFSKWKRLFRLDPEKSQKNKGKISGVFFDNYI